MNLDTCLNHVPLAILNLFDGKVSTPMIIWIVLKDAFFNKFSGSPCSVSEYTHATRVWDAFGCETIADYHNVYLQLDVFLLADFFEKFRRTCLEFYSLDPLHYYSTHGMQLLECRVFNSSS